MSFVGQRPCPSLAVGEEEPSVSGGRAARPAPTPAPAPVPEGASAGHGGLSPAGGPGLRLGEAGLGFGLLEERAGVRPGLGRRRLALPGAGPFLAQVAQLVADVRQDAQQAKLELAVTGPLLALGGPLLLPHGQLLVVQLVPLLLQVQQLSRRSSRRREQPRPRGGPGAAGASPGGEAEEGSDSSVRAPCSGERAGGSSSAVGFSQVGPISTLGKAPISGPGPPACSSGCEESSPRPRGGRSDTPSWPQSE
ncbi:hypothetical protein QYF61_001523 [Mycteria americana]|uniref:Uncharacterized protein n=1 Tax=Mycteria americana TaxID=33587 RepID=A0AAN7P2Y9_MYCAM|nr:hypothetical protein QYF61_001523 [Mycteria americana]